MAHHGDIALGSTIDLHFTTASNGLPTSLLGTPSVAAYPNNSTTEITAGITLTVDFDARTGLNHLRIVATSGNGYAAGNYSLVITAGTVAGVSVVGTVVGSFSIEARSAVRPTTSGRTLTVESDGMAHADMKEWLGSAPSALIAGRVDANTQALANDVITAAAIAANAIGAAELADGAITAAKIATDAIDADALAADAIAEINATVDQALVDARLDELLAADSDIDGLAPPAVGSVFHELLTKTAGSFTYDQGTDSLEALRDNQGTPQTGDSFARLGAPAGVSVSADIAAIEAQTDDIGVAGAGLAAVPWNSAWDAEVQSEVADALDAAVPGTPTANSLNERIKTMDDADIPSRLPTALVAGRMSSDAVAISGSTAAADGVETNIANLDAAVSSRSTVTTAQVNAEVVDALNVDTYAEPGQGAPAATTTIRLMLQWLYKWTRNQKTNDGTTTKFFADDATTVDQKQTTSEAAGTVTKGEIVSGP